MIKLSDKISFESYVNRYGAQLQQLLQAFDAEQQQADLMYTTQASAVFSSNIEGNSIDLNSYMNLKLAGQLKKPQKELKEIEDLVAAYQFAQQEKLTEKNLLKAHKQLSKTFLIAGLRCKYRNDKVGVFGKSGLVYMAVEPELVQQVMKDFFIEIETLLATNLTVEEVFYYAAFLHLRFAHIHPFRDGNGRAARLLEKWFLAQKAGDKFWKLASEKYYKDHQADYYRNINLGVNYYELNYQQAVPFLGMLTQSLQ